MQNRVNPFGEIIETRARGLWMGNRGKIHDQNKKIIRSSRLKAWLICRLNFKGRKRQIMAPNSYTELFFLDEATAFAAGHRPCFECRRADFNKFKALWLKSNAQYHFNSQTSIKKIDEILDKERRNKDGSKKTFSENINNLPDGTFISSENNAYLLFKKNLYLWTPSGYKKYPVLPPAEILTVLTPKSVVKTFCAGYKPQISMF